jgi:hypothetical protein
MYLVRRFKRHVKGAIGAAPEFDYSEGAVKLTQVPGPPSTVVIGLLFFRHL